MTDLYGNRCFTCVSSYYGDLFIWIISCSPSTLLLRQFTWIIPFISQAHSHCLKSGDCPLSPELQQLLLTGLPSLQSCLFLPPSNPSSTLQSWWELQTVWRVYWDFQVLAPTHTGIPVTHFSLPHNPGPRNTAVLFVPGTCHILFPCRFSGIGLQSASPHFLGKPWSLRKIFVSSPMLF